jgi:hypothetical protein
MIATAGPYRGYIVSRPGFLDLLVRSEPFRVFQILLGFLLMAAAGIVGLLSPAPIGIVIFGAGVALVFRNSRWARRHYLMYTRSYPKVRRAVDFGLRRDKRRSQRAQASPPSLTNTVTDPTSPTMPPV